MPLVISVTGLDVFRVPKELAFRATAILLMIVGVFAVSKRSVAWESLWRARQEVTLVVLIILWTAVTTMTSTNRALSLDSLVTVICAAAIFLAARLTAPRVPILVFDLLLVGACVNALLVTVQEYGLWNPFKFSDLIERHSRSTALIGNPNEVGAYLVAPAVAAIVAAVIISGLRRWTYATAGILLVTGLIASGTRTAIFAYLGGLVAFALTRSWRQSAMVLVGVGIISALMISPRTRVGQTMNALWTAAIEKRYDKLFSERLPPFLCAFEMSRAHLLTGVGPGSFTYNYMDYRIGLASKYPAQWTQGAPINWGEVHNDHLQVLAETGLPGYGLFLAGVFIVVGAQNVFRRRTDATMNRTHLPKQVFGRNLRVPLAVVFLLLALAQFPLQLAAPRFVFLTLGALCLGWDDHDQS